MANILVRSPRFQSVTLGASALSAQLSLYIDGALRYTIVKNGSGGSVITFEIAELVKDYIDQTFTGARPAQAAYADTTGSLIHQYDAAGGATGGGSVIAQSQFNHVGYAGYGTFMQGVNPEVSNEQWLISKDVIKDGYYVYAPENTAGWISQVTSSGLFTQAGFSDDPTNPLYSTLTLGSTDVNIIRIDCSKYGDGKMITFVNKFGAIQDLWFFLKEVKTTSVNKETYQANTISDTSGTATYSVNSPTRIVYSKRAKQSIVLSSGYYPEGANPHFEQLLLSDQVWLTQPDPYDPSTEQVVPVIVSNNSFTYKTSLNDKLIEYTMTFEMAFDYINNVR